MDVAAEARAQRRVQQVRRGVVGLGRAARRRVDRRDDALALVQLAPDGLEHERLVVAEPDHVDHARRAAAVLAADLAHVGDLAAAGGVEGRLDELRQHLPVLEGDRADRGRLLGRLVARELGARSPRRSRTPRSPRGRRRPATRAARGARARARGLHLALEARRVDAHVLLGRQLRGQLEREAVGVVQLERLLGADALQAAVPGARDVLVEQPRALLERARELLLLAPEPHLDRLRLLRAAPGRRCPSRRARAPRTAPGSGPRCRAGGPARSRAA